MALPADYDRAWDGLIYYKKGSFVSRYEAYWGVVRRESSRGLQRIDLFRPLAAVDSTSDLFIPLHDVLHVLNRDARAKKFAFQILATGCKYHLATETPEDREKWVQGLKRLLFGPPRPGVVYEHQVMVIPNSHSEKLQLSGRYILRITDSHIALFTSTGTLPTRFLYSLSDVARTRYTTFTEEGQKFSVLVLYCHGDVNNDYTDHKSSSSSGGRLGSGGMLGDEGMFVFQTKSASAMSRTIEYRAKEIAKKGQHRTTSPCSIKQLPPPNQPLSLPTCPKSPLHEKETPVPSGSQSSSKPRPPPRPVRTSTQDFSLPTLDLDPNYRIDSTLPIKTKKAPIPLPRTKKYSLDSISQQSMDTAARGPPLSTKPRPSPRPKPTLRGLSSHGSLASSSSITSVHSLPNPTTEASLIEEPEEVDNGATLKGRSKKEPMYINLSSSSASIAQEEEVGEMRDEKVIGGVEEGKGLATLESKDSPALQSNLPPLKSCDGGDLETTSPYDDVLPSKSCDLLSSPSHREESTKEMKQKEHLPQELQQEDQVVPSPPSSSERGDSPTLDDFLASILRQRRESKDINQQCDNENNHHHQRIGRFSLSRTKSNDPRIMMRAGVGHVGSPQTPHYYNLPPLLRSKGLTVDEDEDEDQRNILVSEAKEEKKPHWGDSLEREYRSEWLRRGSSVQILMPMTREENGDSSEDEDPYSLYLKILPSTAQSLPHPSCQPAAACVPREHRPSSPTQEEQQSTPESGSPLWGTHRASSRQGNVPSPLTQAEAGRSPPLSPRMLDPPNIPEEKVLKSSSSIRKKKRMASNRRSQKRETLSRENRKVTVHEETDLDWALYSRVSSRKRSSRRKHVVNTFRAGPLPSLPANSVEVDSDYEWAEVEEVLSDTGSDYIYTTPFDLGLEINNRRSTSCSELAPFLPNYSSISQRPPAPLPLASPDPDTEENPSHVQTPDTTPRKSVEEKRSTFQRSHSVGAFAFSTSEIYEDLETHEDYEYIHEFEGDYDYAAVPNRSRANLFHRQRGEYVDINRNSPSHTPSSSSSSSSASPSSSPVHTSAGGAPTLPPRKRPRPPPRPLTSLPITDV